ncbi:MAG: MotA/TolQ/ExbB proton channel family protein [Bacteroidales bacterium]|jgi:biopolymer transport protein ExbB
MAKNKSGQSLKDAMSSVFAVSALLVALAVAIVVYVFVMGNPENFQGNNPAGSPLPGNFLGMIYKGGFIVPLLITAILVLLTFTFERLITIEIARGGPIGYAIIKLVLRIVTFVLALFGFLMLIMGDYMIGGILLVGAIILFCIVSLVLNKYNAGAFLKNIQNLLAANKIEEALVACDKQRGSIANVAKSTLSRYRELQNDGSLNKDQKILAIQKEFDEAATLEAPMLSKNLVFLSTLASLCVLIGLLGTVFGMIRAFAALAQAGSPDALALATGISEALINTAFGISGSASAIILYNYFSSVIDGMTFKIDEAGLSIVQTFAANTK